MDLYKIAKPSENLIIAVDKFLVNTIMPLSIQKINEEQYCILFYAEQNSTESFLFLQSIIAVEDDIDRGFLNNHPLNITNIQRDPKRLSFYNEKIKMMKGNTFNTDFDMNGCNEDDPKFFHTTGVKHIYIQSDRKNPRAGIVDIILTRYNYIIISLFMRKLLSHTTGAENLFTSNKLKHITFETMTHVKLDGSCTDICNKVVRNHYTIGDGPTMYKMTFISPMKENAKLRNPMVSDHYIQFYGEDFVIQDIIYDQYNDRIFIIYEQRSDITKEYKATKALILKKEVYDHTNFVDLYKIYENNKEGLEL